MAKKASVIRFLSRRPIDCSFAVLNSFVDIALAAGEVPLANLKRGVPMAEMLFFAIDEEKKPIGVGAIRYSNSAITSICLKRQVFQRCITRRVLNLAGLR